MSGYKGDGGHDGDFCNDPVWSDAEWEQTECRDCGEPSDGYILCGRCLTREQREREAPFSDDVIPSQREVA
jgi:hypothetical protein